MRIICTLIVIFFVTALNAQTVFPGSFQNNNENSFARNRYDSNATKKWFFSKYTGITAGYSFFRGGNAAVIAAPIGIQLNRRLNNNFYAFAGVSAAPAYINFNHAFLYPDINKTNAGNSFFKTGGLAMYSKAELGLMYINNEKTFSISGSIGIERNNFPVYYNNQINAIKPNNNLPSYR